MSKARSTGNLNNSIVISDTGAITFVSGSTTLATLNTAGQLSGSTPVVFAATSSFANAFTVAGTLTAQTLVVQTVTSSIVYSSGSNVFGNNIANTQVLTGSVTVTGSLAVVTNGTEFQVTSTGVRLGNISADTHTITGSVNVSGSNTIAGDLTLSGNRNIYLSNTNPAAGAIRFFNTVSGSTKSAIGSYFNVADEGNLEFLTGGSTTRMIISSSGNVGIGTTSPLVRFQITQPNGIGTPTLGTSTGGLFIAGDGNQYGLYIGNDGNTGSSWLQAMRNNTATAYNILLNPVGGNVGIGTSSPYVKLDVRGGGIGQTTTDFAVGSAGTIVYMRTGATTGNTTFGLIQVGNTGDNAGGNLVLNQFGGNVGIGTTGPSHTLTVAGNVGMSRFYSTVAFSSYTADGLFNAASRYCTVTPPGGGEIRFGYNDYGGGQYWGRIGFSQTTNWSLGGIGSAGNDFSIGTGYQGVQLYIYANGNYDFTGSDVSDRRKKTNINYITTNQLDNILKLKPVTFNKITDEVVNENVHTGFIAQDIMEDGIPNLVMGSDEGGYGLDYNGILALTVKAIQELKAENDILKEILQRNNIQ
jgi:hypothetical protein